MLTLVLAFLIISLLYSSVGFGGGSSYIALLAISGMSYSLIPKVSLICNILVVSSSCYHFYKKDHLNPKLALPYLVSSVPMATLGGYIPVSENIFYILLISGLLFCGFSLLFKFDLPLIYRRPSSLLLSLSFGAIIGFVSGMIGIGGGIFLSPFLIYFRYSDPKEAATLASFFILLNSLAALAGQFLKNPGLHGPPNLVFLFLAVIIGGQVGSRIGSHAKVTHEMIKKGTGLLIIFISTRLMLKFMGQLL